MDQVDLGCVGGEEKCFFQGRIAAAHHRDFFIFEEESIAGCAPRDAIARKCIFTFNTQLAVLRTSRENNGFCEVYGTVGENNLLNVAVELQLFDILVANIRAEALRLGTEIGHELGPLDSLHKTGEIFDLGCGHESTTGGEGAREEYRLKVGTRRVDGGSVPGRAGTHDNNVVDLLIALRGRFLGFFLGGRGCGKVQTAESGASEQITQCIFSAHSSLPRISSDSRSTQQYPQLFHSGGG